MDEGDTCRICRTGAEDDARLYHPCKCSGSIAKVHQDCLIEWLQHSKKKSCELCNTELRFHKLYSTSMPSKLPLYLYLRRLILQTFVYVRFTLRAVLVATAWLAILPLFNRHAWRGYFSLVDLMVWGMTGASIEGRNGTSSELGGATAVSTNSSVNGTMAELFNTNTTSRLLANSTEVPGTVSHVSFTRFFVWLIGTSDYKLFLDTLAHNTFEGQMLTCAVVVLFVALFLLREWCLQNLPQPVEGLEFAPAPPVEPAVEQERVAPFPFEDAAANATTADVRELEEETTSKVGLEGTGDVDEFVSMDDLRARRTQWLDSQFQTNTIPSSSSKLAVESLLSPSEELQPNGSADKGKGRMHDDDEADDEVQLMDESNDSEVMDGKGKGKMPASESSEKSVHTNEAVPHTSKLSITDQGSDISDSAIIEYEDEQASDRDDEEHVDDDHDEVDGRPGRIRDRRLGVIGDLGPNLRQEAPPDGEVAPPPPFEGRQGVQDNGAIANGELADPADWEEELENGERLEDDLEGMMEAIGMRGPFANLVTNMTMMFVLCSFILTFFVALPYLIGRVMGVGYNLPRLVRLPVRLGAVLLRFAAKHVQLKPVEKANKSIVQFFAKFASDPQDENSRATLGKGFGQLLKNVSSLRSNDRYASPIGYREAVRVAVLSLSLSMKEAARTFQTNVLSLIKVMHIRSQGTSTVDRVFCIGLGYFYWLIGLAIQSHMTDLYVRWKLRALKTFVDQQLVVLKVLAFILLELVVFPLGCGLLTDLSLHPLWQGATVANRILLIQSKPLSVCFTLWSLGTLYMFALAQFVSHTRSVVRPGVLCFIRDAGDPNFHPIKDILERRSLEQLRKIGISAIIYSAILFLTLGSCTRLIALTTKDTLSLTWQAHRSLTSSGLELCCIATLIPIAVRVWFPSHLVRRYTTRWWKFLASRLRISGFLLGIRVADEEIPPVYATWSQWWHAELRAWGFAGEDNVINEPKPTYRLSGGYARVPADDQAIMTSPLVIRTNIHGVPVDNRAAEAIHVQEEAIKKLTKKPQYTVVYMPPFFRTRITLLVILLWLTICALLLLGFLPPLLVGRSTLTILAIRTDEAPVHDGYAWFLGCGVIGSSHTLGAKAQRMYLKLRTSSNPVRRFGKHVDRFAQRVAFVIGFGFVTSTTFGLCVETYVNGLTRVLVGQATMPPISLLHVWTMGLMEQQLLFEIVREVVGRNVRPNFETQEFTIILRPALALMDLQNGGWRRPKAVVLFRKVFLPAVSLHLAVLIVPFVVLRIIRAFDDRSSDVVRSAHVSSVFLFCLLYIFSGLISRVIVNRMDSWTDVIKDEHYLISTELKNYDSADGEDDDDGRTDKTANGDAVRLNAEGPIPDVLLHAAE